MADFLSRLKKGIDKGTAVVSAKSNTLIETGKLKSEIGTVRKLKNESLLQLGQKVYEDGKAGTFTIESVESLITAIADAEAKVTDLEAKIVKIQEEEKEKMDEINRDDTPVDVVFEEVEVAEEVKEAMTEEEDPKE